MGQRYMTHTHVTFDTFEPYHEPHMRSCHLDVTACAEARRLDKNNQKMLEDILGYIVVVRIVRHFRALQR